MAQKGRSGRRRRGGRRGGGRKKRVQEQGRRMLMNVVDPEEVRVAILGANGRLDELYVERGGGEHVHGNIYKGKVQNVEPSLQAAFVDIGAEKNGFLHVSDIVPPHGGYEGILKKRRKKAPKDIHRMPIDKMLYKGQELLVQVTREQLGAKGPSLTTYVSLPGRYLVLMPAVPKRGVSKKITDPQERGDLMKSLQELDPPKDLGFIIRTAGMGRGREELQNDLRYLMRLWETIVERTKKVRPPAPIYQENDLVIRAIRDYLYEDIVEVLIDSEEVHGRAEEFLQAVMPSFSERVVVYEGEGPLFNHFQVESEIERIFSRRVPLQSGGELIVEQTEALVAIDVNTGRYKGDNSREMILRTNKEAAEEIARQLRLRDLGGLVMLDFIDMESAGDRRAVEETFRNAMRGDRARTTVLPISKLGVMEMTRQRVRQSLKRSLYTVCPVCRGSGVRRTPAVQALDFVRRLRVELPKGEGWLYAYLHPDVALEVSNRKRTAIAELEKEHGRRVIVASDPALAPDDIRFESRVPEPDSAAGGDFVS